MSNLSRTPPNAVSNTSKRVREDQGWVADEDSSEKLSLESAVAMLIAEFKQTNSKIDNLYDKIDAVKSELATVSKDIQALKDDCGEKFRITDIALHSMNEKVSQLNQTVGNLENRNELTIRGIPFMRGEDLGAYFKSICKQLSQRETSVHIRRTRSNQAEGSEGVIVVEFALKNERDEFYSAYLRRHDLKLRHIGLDSDHRVYINENLTIAARKLKLLALELKRNGKLASVFTKQGVVNVRRSPNEPPVIVRTEEDLTQFS